MLAAVSEQMVVNTEQFAVEAVVEVFADFSQCLHTVVITVNDGRVGIELVEECDSSFINFSCSACALEKQVSSIFFCDLKRSIEELITVDDGGIDPLHFHEDAYRLLLSICPCCSGTHRIDKT